MNKPNTVCRVCGKEYFCCSDSKSVNSWRVMACSPECFKEYMNRIEKARNTAKNMSDTEIQAEDAAEKQKTKRKKTTSVENKAEKKNENIIED